MKSGGEDDFEGEEVVDHKIKNDSTYVYNIKWLGYDTTENRWMDAEALSECEQSIEEY